MANRRGPDAVRVAATIATAIAVVLFAVSVWAMSRKLDALLGRHDEIESRIDAIDRQLKDVLETVRAWPSR